MSVTAIESDGNRPVHLTGGTLRLPHVAQRASTWQTTLPLQWTALRAREPFAERGASCGRLTSSPRRRV